MNFLFFILASVFALTVAVSMILLSNLFGPSIKTDIKKQIFECGMDQATPAKKYVNSNFYIIAVIFLVFDIEIVFLYPWASGFSSLTTEGVLAGLIFNLLILFTAFYIIRRKAIEWE